MSDMIAHVLTSIRIQNSDILWDIIRARRTEVPLGALFPSLGREAPHLTIPVMVVECLLGFLYVEELSHWATSCPLARAASRPSRLISQVRFCLQTRQMLSAHLEVSRSIHSLSVARELGHSFFELRPLEFSSLTPEGPLTQRCRIRSVFRGGLNRSWSWQFGEQVLQSRVEDAIAVTGSCWHALPWIRQTLDRYDISL